MFPGHFFLLHSAVLKPYFHLAICEVHAPTDLQAALASQVHIEEEFLLQFQELVFSVGAPLLSPRFSTQPAARSVFEFILICCKRKESGEGCYDFSPLYANHLCGCDADTRRYHLDMSVILWQETV